MNENRYIFGLPKCLFVLLILLFFVLSFVSPILYCNLENGIKNRITQFLYLQRIPNRMSLKLIMKMLRKRWLMWNLN